MIITRRSVTEEQIEVSFPHYSTDNICHWYKAISETKMIKIYSGNDKEYCSIDLTEYNIWMAFDDKCSVISEKEFNDKFYEVSFTMTTQL
jgi:hypothetical protein